MTPGLSQLQPRCDQRPDECILCDSVAVEIVGHFQFNDLRYLYLENCGFDIATCLDHPCEDALVRLYRCQDCGLEFYAPRLPGNARLYDVLGRFDHYYMAEKWEFSVALQDVRDSRDILEVGCGPGLFLDLVKQAYPKKSAMGLELNLEVVRIGQEKGLNIQGRTIEEFCIERGERFDFVCAFQVLEHVADPRSYIDHSLRCLRKGGQLVMSVPNSNGFIKFAVNDVLNLPPHHFSRWNPRSITSLVQHFPMKLERLELEPVADYHKEWYRRVMILRAVARIFRLRFQLIRVDNFQALMERATTIIDRVFIPHRLWTYSQFAGHTVYARFRKTG